MQNKRKIKEKIRTREFILICIIILNILVMSIAKDTFFTFSNLMSIVFGLSADGLIAIGVTLILISGQIDLSVGAVECFASIIIGNLFYNKGFNIWGAVFISVGLCLVLGYITGSLVARLNIAPFIISLGMQGLIRGLCNVLSSGASIPVSGEKIKLFRSFGNGYLGRIPIFFLLLLFSVILGQFLLKETRYCARVFFVGSNTKAANLAGINVKKTQISLYVITAFFAAMAGILSTGRFGVASPALGSGAEGRAITAAVVGGTSMGGGGGSIVGTLMGLIMIHMISNSLIQLGVSVYWQDFVSNLLLIVVIVIDAFNRRPKRS